ncbi:MAG TPA: hypothetical protein VFK26_02370 [Gemmatimonadaceae bacterium]|nr:hypothetical protein [Gemmatimonadaceae bacterium]
MRWIFGTAMITAGLMLGGASAATAQEEGFFHSPVFVAQPGIIHSFSKGAPTEFNARFVTAIPLGIERTTLVGIIQWTPFADNARGGNANAPAFVYGPVVNVFNQEYWSFDVDGLFSYSPAATGNDDYSHKFLFEGDFALKLGKMVNAKSNWNDFSAYAMLAYVVSGLPDGVENRDRMVLLSGLSLPLAPWKK